MAGPLFCAQRGRVTVFLKIILPSAVTNGYPAGTPCKPRYCRPFYRRPDACYCYHFQR